MIKGMFLIVYQLRELYSNNLLPPVIYVLYFNCRENYWEVDYWSIVPFTKIVLIYVLEPIQGLFIFSFPQKM